MRKLQIVLKQALMVQMPGAFSVIGRCLLCQALKETVKVGCILKT